MASTSKNDSDLRAARMALADGGCTLAVARDGEVRTFVQRGVADLLGLLDDNAEWLQGASVADKVVGRGAAALMILGGVNTVYTPVISEPALQFFVAADVDVEYGTLVPNIINRKGDGVCPVESLCMSCATPADCLPLIKCFLSK